jgi:hypothetical protein
MLAVAVISGGDGFVRHETDAGVIGARHVNN